LSAHDKPCIDRVTWYEETSRFVPKSELPGKNALISVPGVFVVCLFLSLGLLLAGCQPGGSTGNSSSIGPQSNPSSGIPALSNSNIETVQEAVVAHVQPAVVQVNVALSGNKGAIGSGDSIDTNGDIVTNNHVVNDAQKIQVVLFDGSAVPAHVVGTDPADDLAVIKITPPNSKLTTIPFGDFSPVTVNRGGKQMTVNVTLGELSAQNG
jgi:S1-C subfamily serine protease